MKSINLIFFLALLLTQCDFDYNNPVDPDVSLPTPGRLQLTQEDEWIRLDWESNDSYKTGYQIMRKHQNEEWQTIKNINNLKQTTYLDSSIKSNIMYHYRIRGQADENKSDFSYTNSLQLDFPAPYDIEIKIESENSIRLTWDDSCSFVNGFKIMRKTDEEDTWITAGNNNREMRYFIDEGLNYDTNYIYYIIGYTQHNESLKSLEHSARIVLDPPSDLIAKPIQDHQIQLDWKYNSVFEAGFIVERRTGITDSWITLATLEAHRITYLDPVVIADKEYAYRVKAFSENYESEYSNQVIGKTEFPSPINLKINPINSYSAEISWTDNCTYETGYIVQYVAEDQTDTIRTQLPANTTHFMLDDISQKNIYTITIQAQTDYNISQPLTAKILFTDSFIQIDSSTLSGSKVNSIDFSPDGSFIAIGREGNICDIWSPNSWSLEQSVEGIINNGSAEVRDVAFANSSPWLAVGNLQGSIRIVDNDGWAQVESLYLNSYPLESCQFSKDDRYLASAQYKYIYLWNTSDWSFFSTLSEHTDQIADLVFSSNGVWLASAGNDDKIIIWSTDSWSELYTLNDHIDDITDLCFSPNSQHLVSGSADGEIRLWSTDDWSSTLLHSAPSAINTITFSSDGNWFVASVEGTGEITIWSTVDWQQIPGISGISQNVTSMRYSPNGMWLVTSLENGDVNIWNLEGTWTLIEE